MTDREKLVEIVTRDPESAGGDRVWASDFVDAYSASLLKQAAKHLQDANPDRSAEFSEGVDWATDELHAWADGN